MNTQIDSSKKSFFHVVTACSFGTILEWYDFTLYAYLAPILSSIFFPSSDAYTSILLTYAVFALGFIVRPIGAIIFGHLGDRLGRKKVLMSSIALMATTTCLIGILPTYNKIGIFAPVLLISLRILQGLSIGGETIGAASFAIESTQDAKRGFTTSLVWACSGIGILLSSVIVTIMTWMMTPQSLSAWGWRLPFLLGALTGILGYYLRKNTSEPLLFKSLQDNNQIEKFPLMHAIKKFKAELLIAAGLYVLSAIITYLIFVYMPVYAAKIIGLPFNTTMMVNTVMMIFMILLVPIVGYCSDVIGRKRILLMSSISLVLFAYPLYYLIANGGLWGLIIGQLLFAVLAAGFQGVITSAVLEMFPANVRYSAAAFGYNLSYSLFGGTTPLIAMYLVSKLNNNTALSLYLIAGGLVAMIAATKMRETFKLQLV